ncbi:keratin, type I cytoskeletal 13-like [Engraulis encrasicolus]|uniref:keratin, type I cytoskeletal 13-like n=1 Tax=Engraulis encrasicolus TaxID=184585 RepID=UPI002FD248B5
MVSTFSGRMSLSGGSMSGGSIRGGSSALSLSGGSARVSVMRAGSVYGGAGGAGVRISGSSRVLSMGGGGGGGGGAGFGFSSGGGFGGGFSYGSFDGGFGGGGSDKFTMQNLNDRLANYMVKVSTLERANAELELKIRQWLETRAKPEVHNFQGFMSVIRELQSKMQGFLHMKGSAHLGIDKLNLALDDYKLKYENEMILRQTVEADVAGLKSVLGDLTFAKTDLSGRLTALKGELAMVDKTYEEDLLALRSRIGHKVNVEVDAAPQGDLMAVLAGVREHYEAVAAKNRKDLDVWFQKKTETLKSEITTNTTTLQVSSSEVTTIKTTVQALQIELMSLTSLTASMESTLAETRTRYAGMLSGYQAQVCSLEAQLGQLKSDLQSRSLEYSALLDIKTKLEMEIAEYNRILGGQVASLSAGQSMSSSSGTKTVRISEEVIGGGGSAMVSSSSSSSARMVSSSSSSSSSSYRQGRF